MTPNERELLARLFDRIDAASSGPRDSDAEALINERVAANPSAPYRMAQTIAVQDEALKRAEERIRNLESGSGARQPETAGTPSRSLADEANAAVPPRRSAVPSAGARPAGFGGGGFLAGAGQVALGIVGGTLLMEGIRGLTGDDGAAQAATTDPATDPSADTASDAAADPGADAASGDGGEWDTAGLDDGGDGGGFLDGMFDDFGF
ncbi:DUF2076 domain-containing protein [Amorphus coralli]|uniref:DUF2076 domain-containing protein n=1 Tax=Amorphus coralli TaxID=340680 RepID=UPI00035DA99D|nr:DUF2076 family protein [Amorphus coralli]